MEAIILGVWGVGIFEDDLTMDVKDCFDELKSNGFNPFEATVKIIKIFDDVIKEDDNKFLVFAALIRLQLNTGCLQKELYEKFLNLNENIDLIKWKQAGLIDYWKRKSVIKDLKKDIKKVKDMSPVRFELLNYCITESDNPYNLKFTVYELCHPDTGKPIYVGNTAFYNQRTKFMKAMICG